MKQAFSLLELAFCIVLLGIIFSFYYHIFYFKTSNMVYQNQYLYEVEKNLIEKKSLNSRNIQIYNYIFVEHFDNILNLKSLQIKDDSYKKYFYDEESL
ncbi:prepilin-type N-terminal cleavage/methylation domain-containing protein [Campylobacter insulaenigrae]|uniref:prepilin-type N-terminal cleavage/methylation domain-containing protein n=1 Tax=Campylobacter insulaenigrae TaxID=260714 RepID=UPI00242AF9A0|nr:prepilin-type N-terminal cleavage/methylation domain-containing protein [Campylobacter insulaenigrae]